MEVAPADGTPKVTVTPGTGFEYWSRTVTPSPAAKEVPTCAAWVAAPAWTVAVAGAPGSLTSKKVAGEEIPATAAVTE